MITFELYIKNKITGKYEPVSGTVNPISTEDLLDEALDQAFLELEESLVEIIPPCTEVKVAIYQEGQLDVEKYYIVGLDESTETPLNVG